MTSVSASSARPLVDTNVLVYPYDPRDLGKQQQAVQILDLLLPAGRALLSTQCLVEFFNVVVNRLPQRMSPEDALARVETLAQSCEVLAVTPPVVLEGCRGVVVHRLSIWDSMIWAVAKLNQVPVVLTEDQEHGRFIEGVRFLNPFDAGFDLGLLRG